MKGSTIRIEVISMAEEMIKSSEKQEEISDEELAAEVLELIKKSARNLPRSIEMYEDYFPKSRKEQKKNSDD